MANICFSSLSVGSYEDTEKFINAVKNGFTLNDKTYENPFYEMDEIQFKPEDGKYLNTIHGTTKWNMSEQYLTALSKFLNTPVGSTDDEEMICCATLANDELVYHLNVDRVSYLIKHNLQDSDDLYAEDNYNDYQDDLWEGLDLALKSLFYKLEKGVLESQNIING